jgi:hypothetical protein
MGPLVGRGVPGEREKERERERQRDRDTHCLTRMATAPYRRGGESHNYVLNRILNAIMNSTEVIKGNYTQ